MHGTYSYTVFIFFSNQKRNAVLLAVCRKCWQSVSDFHQFSIKIQNIHCTLNAKDHVGRPIDICNDKTGAAEPFVEGCSVWLEPKVEIDGTDSDPGNQHETNS